MRIAFAVAGTLDQISGGFVYDRALVGALGDLGHEIELVSLPRQGYMRAVVSSLQPWRQVWERHRGHFDVIIEDELIHPALALRGRVTGEASTPRIALVHNLRSRQPGERWTRVKAEIERRYLAGVDGMIAVCSSTLDDARTLLARGRVRGRRIDEASARAAPAAVVVHPGRDHVRPDLSGDVVVARSREGGPLRVLHVAALARHKGLLRLLGVLARKPRFDFRLDVVGSTQHDRGYVRDVRAFVRAHALDRQVHLHGERRGDELLELYRRAHVMALPSDREAYSLACLEALGFGLPVLATANGGLCEMISPNDACGELLDPDDAGAWARTLETLASDRGHLERCGRAALARYRQHRSWGEVALRVQDFLSEVVARRAAHRARRSPASAASPG